MLPLSSGVRTSKTKRKRIRAKEFSKNLQVGFVHNHFLGDRELYNQMVFSVQAFSSVENCSDDRKD